MTDPTPTRAYDQEREALAMLLHTIHLDDLESIPGLCVGLYARWNKLDDRARGHWRDQADRVLAAGFRRAPEPQQQGGEDYGRGVRDGLAEAFRIVDSEWYDQHSTQRHEGANMCAELMDRLRRRLERESGSAPAPSAPAGVSDVVLRAALKEHERWVGFIDDETMRKILAAALAAAMEA